MVTGYSVLGGRRRSSASSVATRPCSRTSVSMRGEYRGSTKKSAMRPKKHLSSAVRHCDGAHTPARILRESEKRQGRSAVFIRQGLGWLLSVTHCRLHDRLGIRRGAHIARTGIQYRCPHLLVGNAVGTNNCQVWELAMQAFDLRDS